MDDTEVTTDAMPATTTHPATNTSTEASTNSDTGADTDAISEAIEAERRFLTPQVRSDPAALERLLDPDFTEFGKSGHVWDREEIVEALVREHRGTVFAEDFTGRMIADGAVLVTYRTDSPTGPAMRSSIWRHSPAGQWRILFHQGTPTDYID